MEQSGAKSLSIAFFECDLMYELLRSQRLVSMSDCDLSLYSLYLLQNPLLEYTLNHNNSFTPSFMELFFTHCIFFMLLILLSQIHCSESYDSADQFYQSCSNDYSCGNITQLGYPFRSYFDPEYCGYPGFELVCDEKNLTTIQIMNVRYRVLEVYQPTQTMKVVREDILGSICPQNILNTTLDYFTFDYATSYTNITFLFGCPDNATTSKLNHVVCGSGDYGRAYVSPGAQAPGKCNASVVIPVIELGDGDGKAVDFTRLDEVLRGGFDIRWKMNTDEACSDCAVSEGRCGYDVLSNSTVCYCPTPPYKMSISCSVSSSALSPASIPFRADDRTRKQSLLNIGLGIAVVVLAATVGIGWLIIFCRQQEKRLSEREKHIRTKTRTRTRTKIKDVSSFSKSPATLKKSSSGAEIVCVREIKSSDLEARIFSYADLEEATDNFNQSRELGDGGYGTVYYGKLKDGREIAVKRLYKNNFKCIEQFTNEVEILTKLHHDNLVTLYGCTSKQSQELLLVYEYISNGTVADHLHGKLAKSGLLSWPKRLNIAIETAGALAYLHRSDIVHRDVKTANILLDGDFHVKVADFGLSRLFPTDVTHVSTAPQGTPGYMDPEYYQVYQLTEKSDVYSFGVVLVELVSSLQAVDMNRHRSNVNLATMALDKIRRRRLYDLADPGIGFMNDSCTRRMMTSVAKLAFRCLQKERCTRPSMNEVLEALNEIQNKEGTGDNGEVLEVKVVNF